MTEFEIRARSCGDIEEEFIVGGAVSAPWTGSDDDDANANPAVGGNNIMLCEATNGTDDAAAVAAAAAATLGFTAPGVTMAWG